MLKLSERQIFEDYNASYDEIMRRTQWPFAKSVRTPLPPTNPLVDKYFPSLPHEMEKAYRYERARNLLLADALEAVGKQGMTAVEAEEADEVEAVTMPLARNPRAKMQGVHDGFVKLFCRPGAGNVIGGVVVGPHASELIHPVSIAVAESLTADQLAQAFTVYPSVSGSIAEAARRLHNV